MCVCVVCVCVLYVCVCVVYVCVVCVHILDGLHWLGQLGQVSDERLPKLQYCRSNLSMVPRNNGMMVLVLHVVYEWTHFVRYRYVKLHNQGGKTPAL